MSKDDRSTALHLPLHSLQKKSVLLFAGHYVCVCMSVCVGENVQKGKDISAGEWSHQTDYQKHSSPS